MGTEPVRRGAARLPSSRTGEVWPGWLAGVGTAQGLGLCSVVCSATVSVVGTREGRQEGAAAWLPRVAASLEAPGWGPLPPPLPELRPGARSHGKAHPRLGGALSERRGQGPGRRTLCLPLRPQLVGKPRELVPTQHRQEDPAHGGHSMRASWFGRDPSLPPFPSPRSPPCPPLRCP